MAEQNTAGTKDKVEPIKNEKGPRQRSSISFPYYDLGEAITLAKTINNEAGTTCSLEQLAAWLKLSVNSSGFRSRIGTTKLFGIITTDRADGVSLTELGRQVIDAKREREGRAKAFLTVPLFSAVFEKFKSGALPPAAALENELVALGVADTLKTTARQVMERSAEKAGFFEAGRDRLVKPGFKESASGGRSGADFGGGDGGGPPIQGIHPLIDVLLQALPETGAEWPVNARTRWLQALSGTFDKIYTSQDLVPKE